MYADLTIECGDTEYDCHPFRGESTTTDRMGKYSLEIELDESYDGAELLLSLMGENTSHIVDTAKMDEPPVGTDIQAISIDRAAPPSPVFGASGLAGLPLCAAPRRFGVWYGRLTGPELLDSRVQRAEAGHLRAAIVELVLGLGQSVE